MKRQPSTRKNGEAEVLGEHSQRAAAAPVPDRQPVHRYAVDRLGSGLAGLSQRQYVDLEAELARDSSLARDPRLAERIGTVQHHT